MRLSSETASEIAVAAGSSATLVLEVAALLATSAGQDKHQLAHRLTVIHGDACDKREVNRILYGLLAAGFATCSTDVPPKWSMVFAPQECQELSGPGEAHWVGDGKRASRPEGTLRAWQQEALSAWARANCRGVVQAVTGTGKTRVGLEAAFAEVERGGRVLILVPTIALLAQWYRDLVKWFPVADVGRRGDGFSDSFRSHWVIISTPQSAIRGAEFTGNGLLVADECHRYGAVRWGVALHERFGKRLGLTATYRRQDEGDKVLAAYFGATPVYDIGYRRAIDDGIVSPFLLAFLGVDLAPDDMDRYREYGDVCRRSKTALVEQFGIAASPFGEFMKDVVKASEGRLGHGAVRAARAYLAAFSKRRALLANCPAKSARLLDLDTTVRGARGTLVFTQTRNAAESIIAGYQQRGYTAAAIFGDSRDDVREGILSSFRDGETAVVAAPRILDEGIDVPAADLAIVVSASNSPRQMIQRMGRVLRLKGDGRHARMVVLYARGTTEDPACGAHESFIHLARSVASEEEDFGPSSDAKALYSFLSQ